MERLFALAFVAIFTAAFATAQTSDLVFFTDDGAKFTLIVDGDVKNETPATRVIAAGIRTESPVVMIRFEDASIPQIRKPGYFELGKEYTVMITTNKKGDRVLRPTGEAELGTASRNGIAPVKPVTFVEDAPASTTQTQTITTNTDVQQTGGVDQVTTITVVEEDAGTGGSINMDMDTNGMGVNMNVNVNDGIGTNTTTTRTTTRTTTTTTTTGTGMMPTSPATTPAPVEEPAVYHMPGYNGKIGCPWPMSTSEFEDAKNSIESKGFEETKMTMAKQIGRDRCFTVEQVKGVMGVFGFEDTKLDFAKFAYDRTYDVDNYYKVNDMFSFESTIDELNKYVGSR